MSVDHRHRHSDIAAIVVREGFQVDFTHCCVNIVHSIALCAHSTWPVSNSTPSSWEYKAYLFDFQGSEVYYATIMKSIYKPLLTVLCRTSLHYHLPILLDLSDRGNHINLKKTRILVSEYRDHRRFGITVFTAKTLKDDLQNCFYITTHFYSFLLLYDLPCSMSLLDIRRQELLASLYQSNIFSGMISCQIEDMPRIFHSPFL